MNDSFWDLLNYGNWMHLPVLTSEHGRDVDLFIYYVHWLMAVLFVGWVAYFVYVLYRFRKSRHPKADYQGVKSSASSWIEGAVVVVEAVLLLGFAIPLWAKQVDNQKFPDEKDATVVRVIAQQFAWNGRYPGKDGKFGRQDVRLISGENPFGVDPKDATGKDDVAAAMNDIWVPVDKPVIIHLSSMDVIHSLSIHPLRICQDAIPGMSIPLHFTPTKPGRFMITCAQLCGNSHYAMRGNFTVATRAEYDKWMAGKAPATASFE
jgi:cytochrome c oxidase subunit II